MPYTTYVSDYIEQQESIQPNVSFDKVPFWWIILKTMPLNLKMN
jgi:hypothetical protein